MTSYSPVIESGGKFTGISKDTVYTVRFNGVMKFKLFKAGIDNYMIQPSLTENLKCII